MSCFIKNKWKRCSSVQECVKKYVKNKIKSGAKLKIQPILPKIELKPGLKINFEIVLTAFEKGRKEEYGIPAKIELTTCPKCSKRGTQYFEGILQSRNVNEDILGYIDESIKKQEKKGVFLTKKVKVKSGFDLYFTSNRYVVSLGNELQRNFGGLIKTSSKLFSRDRHTGKNLYRITILYEAPDFKKDDIIAFDNKIVKIEKMGRKIFGYELKNNKKIMFEFRNITAKVLEKFNTTVSKVYPIVEVLHPETYQSVKVENPRKLKMGQEVKIAILKEKIYLV